MKNRVINTVINTVNSAGMSMLFLIASGVLASTSVDAQQPAPKPTVVVGSEISLSSIKKAEWIQGEAPTSFEPGKIYIFECWSTLCVPCIAMIPHVNELHKKYYDQGLRVYGMSVYENDKEEVKKFVKKKGDQMSYPVAFTGKGGAFEVELFRAAGGKGIPHAFIVRNGKLLASTQASRLTESLIEQLLSGDEGAKKVSDSILVAQTHQGEVDKLLRDIKSARGKKDTNKMTEVLKDLKAIEPAHPEILPLELWALMISKDWPAAVRALSEMPASNAKGDFVLSTGMRTAMRNHDYPEDFMKALVKSYSDYVMFNEYPIGPNHLACLSILQWRVGDKKNAVITADRLVDTAKGFSRGIESYTKPYMRFSKSVNEGIMPKFSDLTTWRREARREDAEAKQKNAEGIR